MKNFKKMAIALGVIAPVMAFSQTAPQGNPPASNTNARAAAAWYRGGNNPTSPDNIFGTMWNSPIYTYTNGIGSFATYTVQSCQNTPPKTLPLAH